jgi:threonine dehydrogenase-like Zn-dependent dehydrogenase
MGTLAAVGMLATERRRFAAASRVDEIFDPRKACVRTAGLNVDVVIECSGNDRGMRAGLEALAPQGMLVVVGEATPRGSTR